MGISILGQAVTRSLRDSYQLWRVEESLMDFRIFKHLPTPASQGSFWSLEDSGSVVHQIFRALSFPMSILLILFITTGNVLLLRVLWNRRCYSFTSTALISMGFADLAQCLFSMPVLSFTSLRVAMPSYSCLVLVCGVIAWSLVSSSHHLFIAAHRWCAVTYPTRYKSIFSPRSICFQLAFCWTFGTAIGLIPLLGYNNLHGLRAHNSTLPIVGSSSTVNSCLAATISACWVVCSMENMLNLDFINYVLFYSCVLLPLVLVSVFYVLLFKKVKSCCARRGLLGPRETFYLKQKSMATTMVLQVGLVAMSRFPFYLINVVKLYAPYCAVPSWAVSVATIFIVLSVACNPFIYILRDRNIRLQIGLVRARNRVGAA
ncbi:adenosine receptor A2b-like [Microcaecilia unicolor]|uniref:Adenosine receptor A2b-like n=1 Tax=Microcaecilia unicolor TaxID=1415580 RepID=A0A6P7WQS9_9AMPH|nr:adenosine receptor A2b-like [Microcaecilia unicolor]